MQTIGVSNWNKISKLFHLRIVNPNQIDKEQSLLLLKKNNNLIEQLLQLIFENKKYVQFTDLLKNIMKQSMQAYSLEESLIFLYANSEKFIKEIKEFKQYFSKQSQISHRSINDVQNNQIHQEVKEDLSIDEDFQQILYLLPPISDKNKNKYTLIIDLDETLVHYQEIDDEENGNILIRPYAEQFMKEISQYYEIIIFTAAVQEYADWIINQLDPHNYVQHRLYRHHATILKDNTIIKDLSKLGRDLTQVIIIDNQPESFQLQPENGILIQSWLGEQDDRVLVDLLQLLIKIKESNVKDCRKALKKISEQIVEDDEQNSQVKNCDVSLEGTICLFKGEKLLVPQAVPKGLIAHWNFDEEEIYDVSGNGHHSIKNIDRGPSQYGDGYSGFIKSNKYIEIPHSLDFDPKIFTLQMWIYIIKGYEDGMTKTRRWCPLIQKGNDILDKNIFERSPALFFDTKERNLKIYQITNDLQNYPQGEELQSNARITLNKWNHIAIYKNGMQIRLYVNGILDSITHISNFGVQNDSPLYIGNTPALSEECTINSYIDDIKFYNIAVDDFQIQAEAAPALSGIEPSFVHLGCVNCKLEDAKSSCLPGYHICTNMEIYSGAYQVAAIQGWIEMNNYLWSYNVLHSNTTDKSILDKEGLGVCCKDYKFAKN